VNQQKIENQVENINRLSNVIEEESNKSVNTSNKDSDFDVVHRIDSKGSFPSNSSKEINLMSTERDSLVKKEDKIEEENKEDHGHLMDSDDSEYSTK